MAMNDSELYGTRPRRGMAGIVVAVLLAFVLGVALTAYGVRRSDLVAAWLRPAPSLSATSAAIPPKPTPVRVVHDAVAPADTALAERVAAIDARLDAIDRRATAASGDADRAEALLVAFAARRALDRGQPLGFLEGLLRERFGGSDAPSVALIIASAQRPVTLMQLRDGFDALRPTLATASPDQSWWTGLRREIGNMFVVRHAGTASNVPSDRLARAEHALDEGQVDAAAAEIARLPGSARAADWLASARRYMLARGALDRIETVALLKPPASSPLAAPAGE